MLLDIQKTHTNIHTRMHRHHFKYRLAKMNSKDQKYDERESLAIFLSFLCSLSTSFLQKYLVAPSKTFFPIVIAHFDLCFNTDSLHISFLCGNSSRTQWALHLCQCNAYTHNSPIYTPLNDAAMQMQQFFIYLLMQRSKQ